MVCGEKGSSRLHGHQAGSNAPLPGCLPPSLQHVAAASLLQQLCSTAELLQQHLYCSSMGTVSLAR